MVLLLVHSRLFVRKKVLKKPCSYVHVTNGILFQGAAVHNKYVRFHYPISAGYLYLLWVRYVRGISTWSFTTKLPELHVYLFCCTRSPYKCVMSRDEFIIMQDLNIFPGSYIATVVSLDGHALWILDAALLFGDSLSGCQGHILNDLCTF